MINRPTKAQVGGSLGDAMKVPEHKRFLWTHKNQGLIHIGCIEKTEIQHVGKYPIGNTLEESFERSFISELEFIKWIDDEWRSE
jgi:hypothetical protein